jgi:lipoate---protein ligase
VWVCEPAEPALVLGSAQRDEVADAAACSAAGVEIVRRRSGGGAVLVVPGELLWLDLVLPAGDELWQDDVGRAFQWVGETWRRALADLGVVAHVHTGGLVRTRWSPLVCFAGLGPGELTLAGGAKAVGISQRRTRDAARFQCAAVHRWDPAALLRLLALDDADRAAGAVELAGAAAGLAVDNGTLLDAVLHHLP